MNKKFREIFDSLMKTEEMDATNHIDNNEGDDDKCDNSNNASELAELGEPDNVETTKSYLFKRDIIEEVDEEALLDPEEKQYLEEAETVKTVRKSLYVGIGCVTFVIIAALAFLLGGNFSQSIKVPDFKNKPLELVQEWATKNEMDVKINYQETRDYPNNVITYQFVEAGTKINKGTVFEIYVSQQRTEAIPTPDGDKSQTVIPTESNKPTIKPSNDPDKGLSETDAKTIIGKSKKEAEEWAKTKNVTIKYSTEYSDTKEKDKILSIGNISTKKGKTSMTAVVSNGPVVVPEFVGKSIESLETWVKSINAEGAKLQIKKTEVESDEVEGIVVKQSPIKAEIKIGGSIEVEFSAGKSIKVKDFTNKPKSELEAWAKENKVPVTFTEMYSDKIAKDYILYQPVTEGTVKELKMTVKVSLGAFSMPDYRGKTEQDVRTDLQKFANAGVDISVVAREVEAAGIVPGLIVEQSYAGSTLTLSIAKAANTKEVPYMVGMSVQQAQQLAACTTDFICNFIANNPDKILESTTDRITNHSTGNFVQGSIIDIYFDYIN